MIRLEEYIYLFHQLYSFPDCFEYDQGLPNNPLIDTTDRQTENEFECQKLCQSHHDCESFDYHTPDTLWQEHKKSCLLRIGGMEEKTVAAGGVVSGSKYC